MKSVYTGSEKVAEFDDYRELRVGGSKPAFIYEGNELVYPNPVKDGLVLWYDFSGRTNADSQRGIAEDLSGNGNHGTLQNFNYTAESGYDKNKLLFDNVDDYILIDNNPSLSLSEGLTLEVLVKFHNGDSISELIRKGTTFGGTQNYSLSMFSNGLIYFEVNNKGARYNVTYNIPLREKILLCGTVGEGGLKLFANGVLVNENSSEFLGMDTVIATPTIGNVTRSIDGEIYSAKIYNRPLTPEEIAHNYAIEKERFNIE